MLNNKSNDPIDEKTRRYWANHQAELEALHTRGVIVIVLLSVGFCAALGLLLLRAFGVPL